MKIQAGFNNKFKTRGQTCQNFAKVSKSTSEIEYFSKN